MFGNMHIVYIYVSTLHSSEIQQCNLQNYNTTLAKFIFRLQCQFNIQHLHMIFLNTVTSLADILEFSSFIVGNNYSNEI